MTFKNLLVHVDDDPASGPRLETAAALARTYDAHLTCLYVALEPNWPGYVRHQMPPEVLAVQERQLKERSEAMEARVVAFVEKQGLNADFRSEKAHGPNLPNIVAMHARYADLAVLGQADPEETQDDDMPAQVLLAAGRPAIVVPYIGARETLGERVMVAWDAGREAARAVNDALPILERAGTVEVLTVNPQRAWGRHGQEPGADIALQLARHGVKVDVQHAISDGMDAADTILSRLADRSSDLLVMGAYGHARLRELFLGGVTEGILRHMTVPVFMSH